MTIRSMRWMTIFLLGTLTAFAGCKTQDKEDRGFFTSGSREADQRAEQRVAKEKQLNPDEAETEKKRTLYERLGGQEGIDLIVNDFVARVLADPRVNFERKGVETGGFLNVGETSAEWQATAGDVATLKKHIAQFIALATGGPTTYEGGEMKQVHAGMKITNAEFDATVGDLKASLDKLNVATEEQKELLAVIETTRVQVVGER